jgi:hypothetical protein
MTSEELEQLKTLLHRLKVDWKGQPQSMLARVTDLTSAINWKNGTPKKGVAHG